MNLLEAIVLGCVQGVTEFLPISSSGHLVLAKCLLGVNVEGVQLEVVVHLATLVAILVYYRRTLLRLFQGIIGPRGPDRTNALRYVGFLALGSVPAGLAGFFLKDSFESAFTSPRLVAAMLMATGVFLLATGLAPKNQARPLSIPRALAMGLAQAFAILPGVSRSGTTVGTGLWTGLGGKDAAEFSFLLAVPAIAGAGLLTVLKGGWGDIEILPMAGAFTMSLVTGYLSLLFLLRLLEKERLHWFGPYCLAVGAGALVWLSV